MEDLLILGEPDDAFSRSRIRREKSAAFVPRRVAVSDFIFSLVVDAFRLRLVRPVSLCLLVRFSHEQTGAMTEVATRLRRES